MLKNDLPKQFSKYFWDIDCHSINSDIKSTYIIERLLEYGDLTTLNWLEKTFDRKKIKKIVESSRRLSKKSANFYAHIYQIDHKEILCLQKEYQNKHKTIWLH